MTVALCFWFGLLAPPSPSPSSAPADVGRLTVPPGALVLVFDEPPADTPASDACPEGTFRRTLDGAAWCTGADGRYQGPFTLRDPRGQLRVQQVFAADRLDGESVWFGPDGTVVARLRFADGVGVPCVSDDCVSTLEPPPGVWPGDDRRALVRLARDAFATCGESHSAPRGRRVRLDVGAAGRVTGVGGPDRWADCVVARLGYWRTARPPGGWLRVELDVAPAPRPVRVRAPDRSACDPRAVEALFAPRRRQLVIYNCYAAAHLRNPRVHAGSVEVSYGVDSNGRINRGVVRRSSVGAHAVGRCITSTVRSWRMAAPGGRGCRFNRRFDFARESFGLYLRWRAEQTGSQ